MFTMIDFIQERVDNVLGQLSETAAVHAAMSGGMLVHTPDVKVVDLRDPSITGDPLNPKASNKTATGIDSRYQTLYEATEQSLEIELIEDTLRSGQNVVLATGHGELVDVALQGLAVANVIKLRRPNLVDSKGRPFFRTSIITSRMIEYLGIPLADDQVLQVRDVLTLGFDKTYLTIPSTVSTKGKIDKYTLKTYNNSAKQEMAADMERRAFSNRRPMLLTFAAPGTVDKPLDTAKYQGDIPKELLDKTIVMGQINYSITEFCKNALTFAAIARMGNTESKVAIDNRPLCLQEPEDVEKLAERIIKLVVKTDNDDTNYIYDSTGTLPVIRKK